MSDTCDDNRFYLIEKYKKNLIEATNIETSTEEMKVLESILFRFWQMGWLEKLELLSAQPEQTRVFVELVVEYPDPELCTYKEYRGKPYYSIKYIENGEAYIGYGTYKPEVLSQYLKEYFISSAQPERLTDDDFETIRIHLSACKEKLCNQRRWKEAEEYQRIIDRLMSFASAQHEIIRCKDCKHRDPEDGKCDCGHDILWQLPRPDNWYCADAKRR